MRFSFSKLYELDDPDLQGWWRITFEYGNLAGQGVLTKKADAVIQGGKPEDLAFLTLLTLTLPSTGRTERIVCLLSEVQEIEKEFGFVPHDSKFIDDLRRKVITPLQIVGDNHE